jgi:hypothetical protein
MLSSVKIFKHSPGNLTNRIMQQTNNDTFFNINFNYDLVQEQNLIQINIAYQNQNLIDTILYLSIDPNDSINSPLVKT